jgi:ubiquinone/menaquinone biosynthesis C-methylase UbiE
MVANRGVQMDTKEFYDQVSPAYYRETYEDVSTLTSIARSIRTQTVLDMMRRHVRPESVVADLGCGPAQFADAILEGHNKYIGLDISREMYVRTAERLSGNPRASFSEGSVESVPLPSESLDAVICIGVLEYLPNNAEALREIHRTLRKGGVAIISFPNLHFPMFFLRSTLRPLIAPVLRRIAPRLRNTVYVSGTTHRLMSPTRFIREVEQVPFLVLEKVAHAYFPLLFNHALPRTMVPLYLKWERLGKKIAPAMGANFIVCLEK